MRLRILSACTLFAAVLSARAEEAAAVPLLEIPEPESMTVRYAPFETEADIRAIAWSPEGRRLAACDSESVITVWSATHGGTVAAWSAPGVEPRCLAWSDDGRVIVAGGAEDVVAWEADSGKELRRIHHGHPVVAVAFEPGTRTLVSATETAGLKRTDLWETEASQDIPSPSSRIRSIAVARDGYRLAVAGIQPQVAILNLPKGTVELAYGPDEVLGATWVAWGPRDTTVFAHIGLGALQEIDSRTGVIVDAYSRDWLEESVALSISGDGRQVAAVTKGGHVAARVRRSISQSWSLETAAVPVPFVAVSQDGSRVAVPRGRRQVTLVSMDFGGIVSVVSGEKYPGFLSWSADGSTLFVTRGPTEVHAFDATTGKRLRGYVAPGNRMLGLSARADGALLAATSGGGWLRVTDLTSRASHLREPLKAPPVFAQLSDDGSTIAWRVTAESDRVRMSDLVGTDELPSIRIPGKPGYWVGAISPKGDVFLQIDGLEDKLLYSETTTGMPLAEVGAPRRDSSVVRMLLSPDGSRTLVHRRWSALEILVSGRPGIGTVQVNLDRFSALQFSPDGGRIAGLGEVLRILDSSDLHQLAGFPIAGRGVALAWSPDGGRIATINEDGVTQIWSVPDAEARDPISKRDPNHDWGDLSCQRADRAFEAAERLQSGDAETVAFLREKLAERENAEHIRRLIGQLRDESFARRQDARDELHWLGVQAEPELLRAMTGEPSGAWRTELELLVRTAEARVGPSSQNLRRQRAMQVLEGIGSADAADVLRHMADESPSPRERQDVQEALRRIELRQPR